MIWFTSDEHYGHRNIIKFCNRPFTDLDDMREGLIVYMLSVQPFHDVSRLEDAKKKALSLGLNVTILHGPNGEIALKCKVCSTAKRVDKSAVYNTDELTADIEQFCRDHRHEAKIAEAPAGRFFRDED